MFIYLSLACRWPFSLSLSSHCLPFANFFFERESACVFKGGAEGEKEGKNLKQAPCFIGSMEPNLGLDLMTMRS